MKIGLVTPGGIDRHGRRVIPVLLSLVERLGQSHELHVYTLFQSDQSAEFEHRGAKVHQLASPACAGRGPRAVCAAMRRIAAEHRRAPLDVLHGVWATEPGFAAATAGRMLGVPALVSVAGGELACLPDIDFGAGRRLRSRWLVAATLRMASALTGQDGNTSLQLAARGYRCRRLPWGADSDRFSPSPKMASPHARVLMVGSLNRVKDYPTALRAFHQILKRRPDARLEIIGEETLGGATARSADELGLSTAVRFRGWQPTAEIARAMRDSDLLLHSSRWETGPSVFLEGACRGLPSAGTRVGLYADLSPRSALAVAPGDADGLADAALCLLRDDDLRASIASTAHDWACAHNADWTATQFASLYSELRQTAPRTITTPCLPSEN